MQVCKGGLLCSMQACVLSAQWSQTQVGRAVQQLHQGYQQLSYAIFTHGHSSLDTTATNRLFINLQMSSFPAWHLPFAYTSNDSGVSECI